MDDRKASLSSHDPDGRVGADAAPIAPRVRHSADADPQLVLPGSDQAERWAANPLDEDPVVFFCGNQQQVNEGFAIALRVMGIDSGFSRGRIPPTTNHPIRRDN
jgi:hypothetical protein